MFVRPRRRTFRSRYFACAPISQRCGAVRRRDEEKTKIYQPAHTHGLASSEKISDFSSTCVDARLGFTHHLPHCTCIVVSFSHVHQNTPLIVMLCLAATDGE